MTFPTEFDYTDEADFIQRCLIPILQRLGYSLVLNFHGTREFGKDLIFAEMDRFGHVNYHGLQAKYVSSLGLKDAESLVSDAKQAFANPFRHPHGGQEQRISVFYAVNGGDISEQARTHFFNSLVFPHGGHVRLLDGKALVNLTQWASMRRAETVGTVLTGLLVELRWNEHIVAFVRPSLLRPDLPLNVGHLRNNAAADYLANPSLPNEIDTVDVMAYWHEVEAFIHRQHSLTSGLPLLHEARAVVCGQMVEHADNILNVGRSLRAMMSGVLADLNVQLPANIT